MRMVAGPARPPWLLAAKSHHAASAPVAPTCGCDGCNPVASRGCAGPAAAPTTIENRSANR
eukprot:9355780-Alexandrium_andersonii.AAC.1